jgi:hypothetical protein
MDALRPTEGHTDVRRLVALLIATAAIAVLPASAAMAGVLVQSAPSCSAQTLSQPFARWLDPLSYTLAPGGGFEAGGPAWKLSGNAAVVAGNEPFYVRAKSDTRSLRLPSGSSVTSPVMCVGLAHPTIRMFTKVSGGVPLLSSLRIEALVEDNLGLIKSLPVLAVPLGSQWAPTLPGLLVANLLPLLPGDMTPIAFKITAVGPGTWSVDDVYVDPWGHR